MDHLQTDLTPEQISQIACLGVRMPRSNILFASFPRELFRSAQVYDPVLEQDVSIWDADFNSLGGYVSEFEDGNWPTPSVPGSPPSELCLLIATYFISVRIE
jgi:hypothetical protein